MTLSPNQIVIWQPQPGPQTALITCPVFEVFYGGARGGGKTDGSVGDWLQHSALYGEYANGLFVRRKLVQLTDVIARTKQIYLKIGAKFNEQKKEWRMPGGGRLRFAYLEKDSDAEEYQGHNYTRVYVEEATNFPSSSPIDKLRATLRSTAGVPVGMRLTGNPGGPGHNWVRKRYIDPCPTGYKVIAEEDEIITDSGTQKVKLERVFIPSKVWDNKKLIESDPTYILRLKQSGSEQLVKAWLDGDWTSIEGVFFDVYDPSIHMLSTNEWLGLIPRNAFRFRSFDWGSAKPFSVGWYVLSDGTWGLPFRALLKYREWYGASGPNKGLKMTADLVAKGIRERERLASEIMRYGVADPSIFIRDGGPSIAETMAIHGVQWKRGDNKRKSGAELVRQRLVGEDGVPLLYLLDNCEATHQCFSTLQHDEDDPEDVDTEAEDHAYDETRYAITSRPWIKNHTELQQRTLPKNLDEYTINELVAINKSIRLQRASEYE